MGFHQANSCLSHTINDSPVVVESEHHQTSDSPSIGNDTTAIPPHPLGIKPLGNAYAAKQNVKSAAGSFATLPDELLVQVFEHLDATALQQIGITCRALCAFSRIEDLWKTLYLGSFSPQINWRGLWRLTYLNVSSTLASPTLCSNLFSDVLYRPFLCTYTSLSPYIHNIPAQNTLPRLSNITAAEFVRDWTDQPFILTAPVRAWPVYEEWSRETLLKKYGDIVFRAEAVDWPLNSYVDYMENNTDESPLYLFDRSFVEKMGLRVGKSGQYWAPECFGEDLFNVLGNQRPDSRWLIMGSERSGSTFHKDPNATSAWNAVLRGSKYWIMFPTSPSQPPPPGVIVSKDESEVTSPLSLAEWLIGFHAEARRTPGCIEGICREGDVVHVPSGWWHLVVNLEPSIAITQNFVPEAHLGKVLEFLRNKPEQVSGFKSDIENVYELFADRLKEIHPETLAKAMDGLADLDRRKKRKWEELVDASGSDKGIRNGAFSFGFDIENDEEIP